MEKTYFVYIIIALIFLLSGLFLVLRVPQYFENDSTEYVTSTIKTVQMSDYNISKDKVENILAGSKNSTENIESNLFYHLPDNTRIVIGFYNDQGQEIENSSMTFSIVNSEVVEGQIDNWEVKILTGDYNIPQLINSDDICATLTELKQREDFRIYTNSDPVTLLTKYSSLNNCINLQ